MAGVGVAGGAVTRIVSAEEARRIAVRAQALDGSATGILGTVRRIGYLQVDPISTVAPPQQLVLWSRLGPYDLGELDRLLWEERKLFEWGAFVWPIEDSPSSARGCGVAGANTRGSDGRASS